MRGVLPNADRVLLPGYFRPRAGPLRPAAERAAGARRRAGRDQSGRYLLVVNGDNVVEQRKVQTGPVEGELRVIETGLKPDDRVVIDGL